MKKATRVTFTVFMLAVSVALIVFMFRFWDISFVETVRQMNYTAVFFGVLLLAGLIAARTVRLREMLRKHANVTFWYTYYVQLFSNFVSLFTPGKTGELVKIFMLKKRKVKLTESGSMFVIEKSIDLSLYIFGTLFSMITIGALLLDVPSALMWVMGAIVLFTVVFFIRYMRTRKYKAGTIIVFLAYSLLAFTFTFGIYYVSFFSMGITSVMQVFALFNISTVVGLLSFLPGSRGAAELSAMGIATTVFGHNPAAVAAALTQLIVMVYGGNLLLLAIGQVMKRA